MYTISVLSWLSLCCRASFILILDEMVACFPLAVVSLCFWAKAVLLASWLCQIWLLAGGLLAELPLIEWLAFRWCRMR
jgi:hypothetical protein